MKGGMGNLMKQAQQMQEAQMKSSIEESQARTQLAQARTMADQGLGAERFSRINENRALAQERRSEAVKDDQQALLNFAKAMKEIEGIDIMHLEKILSMQKMLRADKLIEEEEMNNPQAFQKGSELVR